MRRVTLSTDRDLVVLSAVQWRFGFVVKVVDLNDNDNDNGISNDNGGETP